MHRRNPLQIKQTINLPSNLLNPQPPREIRTLQEYSSTTIVPVKEYRSLRLTEQHRVAQIVLPQKKHKNLALYKRLINLSHTNKMLQKVPFGKLLSMVVVESPTAPSCDERHPSSLHMASIEWNAPDNPPVRYSTINAARTTQRLFRRYRIAGNPEEKDKKRIHNFYTSLGFKNNAMKNIDRYKQENQCLLEHFIMKNKRNHSSLTR